MSVKSSSPDVSIENIYKLDGRVPVAKAIPFGLQHVMAMFVSNLAPIAMVCGVAKLLGSDQVGIGGVELARLLQSAMFIAGLGTLIQLYPVWRVGAKLPVVMGVSFTFVATLTYIATNFNYQTMIGAIIVGGCVEGCLGLTYKYWKRIVSPIVSACVVTTIGFSLLSVGARSFGGGYVDDFGAPKYMIVGLITLLSCIIFSALAKGFVKQLNVMFGLVVGYITSFIVGIITIKQLFEQFSTTINEVGFIALPRILPYKPVFNISAILSIVVVFFVSAAETIGDTTAVVAGGLDRDITEKEISGSLACDGFLSSVSGLLGCTPITSFSQNVGFIAMTKVVNRFTIMFGALTLILAGLFPPIGAFFSTLPQPVLGGCTIMMFGTIVVSGMNMIGKCGFNQRNTIIAALSISIGIGFTQTPDIFNYFPKIIADIFAGNSVAGVFVLSMIMNFILPKDMDVKKLAGM